MVTPPHFATPRQSELFGELLDVFLAEGFAHLTLDAIAARLRCSKSTLYTLAGSKEQLVVAATVHFFKRATAQVEAHVDPSAPARDQVSAYLAAVGDALSVVSDQFMRDLDAFAPARAVYERNTQIAAARVKEIIDAGVAAGEFRGVHAAFAAEVAATMMVSIQRGDIQASLGLDDASAYRELSAMLTAGMD
ncbi:TetR/AcrR family transcriptional regulator [Gordonia humi]|uniref:AcrR family transcriptional regulator n=1 Tax=Gordonia humi TaxID=686429 RepID=A0A840F5F2_9ACTN|nr:TetR/AcrR family transcriptional regulator [Gordonia humi]MBB4137884.1 AcrR family transcriptional regulator [Gordonia humi]